MKKDFAFLFLSFFSLAGPPLVVSECHSNTTHEHILLNVDLADSINHLHNNTQAAASPGPDLSDHLYWEGAFRFFMCWTQKWGHSNLLLL